MRLGPHAIARGFRLEVHDNVSSTNDLAMQSARDGDAGRLWIVAAEQTGGRGRRGRAWVSPRGNLYASLLMIDPAPVVRAPQLGFVASLALAEALQSLGVEVALKWPNDVLLGGAKIAGLLLESAIAATKLHCVIGVGVNCVSHPPAASFPATDLARVGHAIPLEQLFLTLSDCLARQLDVWRGGDNFACIRQSWLARAWRLGETISIDTGAHRIEGVFRTIDEEGRLVLAGPDGERAFAAGDVSLRATKAVND